MSIRPRLRALFIAAALLLLSVTAVLSAGGDAFVPGAPGDGPSGEPSVSADGRFVAFASAAANLVPGDENGLQDVFLHDRQTGATILLSAGLGDEGANGFSGEAAVSADGRFVAFESVADNLVPYDNNMESDIFVYDRAAGTLSRASITSGGLQAAGASFEPDISADGRYLVFASTAINLDVADDSPSSDIFIHDRQTGQTALVSLDSTGQGGTGFAGQPVVSADGRLVAFASDADDLVSGDSNGVADIFVRDRPAGKTTRVSLGAAGKEADAESFDPAISADGLVIAFASYATNLSDEATGQRANIFIRDRTSGETVLITRAAGGPDGDSQRPRLSGDGRYVAFASSAANLTAAPDANNASDIFIHDRTTAETELVSMGTGGAGNDDSLQPAITTDGRVVVFASSAANLTADDSNGWSDVFARDRQTGRTTRVSLAGGAVQSGRAAYLSLVIR
ncbi:MAG: PD40 domain-containing protein [Candidatus Promineofilum sp.]|nr:PD40 domain-containing protein [Promineifilum sp.]